MPQVKNVPNYQLIKYNTEIQQLQQSIVGELLATKLNQFMLDNSPRIDTVLKKQMEIMKTYYVFDEKGSPVTEGEGESATMKTTGLITEEEFLKRMDELMSAKSPIKI